MRKIILSLILFLLVPLTTNADVTLPDLGEPINQDIGYSDILNSIKDGKYTLAWNLVQNAALQKIRQELNNEKNIPVVLKWLAGQFESIFNDPNKTEEEKTIEILTIINNAMSDYKSAQKGQLKLQLEHSIEYGVTKLTWDTKNTSDECDGFYITVTYEDGYRWESITYYTDYVRRVPEYSIYRNINGQEELLAILRGNKTVSRKRIGLSDDVWGSLSSVYGYYSFDFNVGNNRAVWFDEYSDYRNIGDQVSYRVVSNDGPYRLSGGGSTCGNKHVYSSNVYLDYDADGKADFIPEAEYKKYFGKYYGWLVPVTTMLLN